MTLQFIITTLLSVILFSSCASYLEPAVNPNDAKAVTRSITAKRDDFRKRTYYTGPIASSYPDALLIRAEKTDTGRISYQIYVESAYYGDWRLYNSVYDSNGTNLNMTVISREVRACSSSNCSLKESFSIDVTQKYLEDNQFDGIRFKAIGKKGEQIFFIPSEYIRAFLWAVR